jgi:hypothetical protein
LGDGYCSVFAVPLRPRRQKPQGCRAQHEPPLVLPAPAPHWGSRTEAPGCASWTWGGAFGMPRSGIGVSGAANRPSGGPAPAGPGARAVDSYTGRARWGIALLLLPLRPLPACRLRVCRYALAHSHSSAVLAASLPGGVMISLRSLSSYSATRTSWPGSLSSPLSQIKNSSLCLVAPHREPGVRVAEGQRAPPRTPVTCAEPCGRRSNGRRWAWPTC